MGTEEVSAVRGDLFGARVSCRHLISGSAARAWRGNHLMKVLDIWLTRIVHSFIVLSLLLASFVVVTNVALRYLFNTGIVGSEELVRYLIIGLTFIGGSTLVLDNEHLTMDALVKALPVPLVHVLDVLTCLIGIAFSVALILYSISVIENLKFATSVALQIPAYIPYLSIPIGAGLTAVRYMQRIIFEIGQLLLKPESR